MKLKISQDATPKHSDFATCVAWSTSEEILSCGDDHQLLSWNLVSSETTKVADLPAELFPTGLQWPPKSAGASTSGSRKSIELLLIIASDGHFYLLGRGGRIEKTVQGHKGAILSCSWNNDGSEILTSGEDGVVRIWSRAGMLRSSLATCATPVYAAAWGPDGQSVIHTNGQNLVIKPIAPSSKPTQWKAHDGIILSLAWCSATGMIISGGEDCKYKVWDSFGRPVFSSGSHDHPITSLAWTPAGDLFAVGGFNSLRLCDKYGWSHCLEKPKVGSIYAIQWSSDGTQFVGAGASGHVFLATITERTVYWKTITATLTGRRTILVTEFTGNAEDKLDFRDRVIKISLNHGYLIVITPTQVYIYSITNLNTPVICDLKENNSISLILQSPKNFALCGGLMVTLWTYEGRHVGNVKWSGMRSDLMNPLTATICVDAIAFVDSTDSKLIRIFDPSSGKPLNNDMLKFKHEVKQISLSQHEYPGMSERSIAVVDKNRELYLSSLKKFGAAEVPKKLTVMVQSTIWHNDAPCLAVIRDGKLRVYYYPNVIHIDPTLIDYTWEDKEIGDLGRSPELLNYENSKISIRRPDGVVVVGAVSPFAPHLHTHAIHGKFTQARRICRYVNDKVLWGVMAGLCAWKGELDLAEICYAEIGHFDKVFFVQDIKENTPDDAVKKAQMALLSGGIAESETILLQANKLSQVIQLNINCHRWERALELALKYKVEVENVVTARKSYLEAIRHKESIPRFLEVQASGLESYTSTSAKSRTRKRRPTQGSGKAAAAAEVHDDVADNANSLEPDY